VVPPSWTRAEAPTGGDRFRRLCARVEADPKRRGFSDDETVFYVPEHWLKVLEYIMHELEGEEGARAARLLTTYEGHFLWQLVACTEEAWDEADQAVRGQPRTIAEVHRPLAELIRECDSGLIFGTCFNDNLLGVLKHATAPKRS